MAKQPAERKYAAQNRKARHNYFIDEVYEAGVMLAGTEVKSLRQGKGNLGDAYATDQNGEIWLYNFNIPEYDSGGYTKHEPKRARKLLLHAHEIRKLIGKTVERGMTLVPLRMYFKDGRVKIALALAKGKQAHDKRDAIKKREVERETRAAVKERRR